jgi:hypothetical protein
MFRRTDFKELVDHLSNKYKLFVYGSYKRDEEFIANLNFLTYNDLDKILKDIQINFNNTIIISNNDKFIHFRLWDILDVYIYQINNI